MFICRVKFLFWSQNTSSKKSCVDCFDYRSFLCRHLEQQQHTRAFMFSSQMSRACMCVCANKNIAATRLGFHINFEVYPEKFSYHIENIEPRKLAMLMANILRASYKHKHILTWSKSNHFHSTTKILNTSWALAMMVMAMMMMMICETHSKSVCTIDDVLLIWHFKNVFLTFLFFGSYPLVIRSPPVAMVWYLIFFCCFHFVIVAIHSFILCSTAQHILYYLPSSVMWIFIRIIIQYINIFLCLAVLPEKK